LLPLTPGPLRSEPHAPARTRAPRLAAAEVPSSRPAAGAVKGPCLMVTADRSRYCRRALPSAESLWLRLWPASHRAARARAFAGPSALPGRALPPVGRRCGLNLHPLHIDRPSAMAWLEALVWRGP